MLDDAIKTRLDNEIKSEQFKFSLGQIVYHSKFKILHFLCCSLPLAL